MLRGTWAGRSSDRTPLGACRDQLLQRLYNYKFNESSSFFRVPFEPHLLAGTLLVQQTNLVLCSFLLLWDPHVGCIS